MSSGSDGTRDHMWNVRFVYTALGRGVPCGDPGIHLIDQQVVKQPQTLKTRYYDAVTLNLPGKEGTKIVCCALMVTDWHP